jgi:hypothetical protein
MSQGGVWTDSLPVSTLVNYTAPCKYATILKEYPDMRLCLAHFGDNKEWDDYLSRNRNIHLSSTTNGWGEPDCYDDEEWPVSESLC